MKKRIIRKFTGIAAGCLAAVSLCTASVEATVINNTPVQSPDMIDGSYAYGSTNYTENLAYATTTHSINSIKTARVYGTFRMGSSYIQLNSADSADYSGTTVTAYLNKPSNVWFCAGSHGHHFVSGNSGYWEGDSYLGEQF